MDTIVIQTSDTLYQTLDTTLIQTIDTLSQTIVTLNQTLGDQSDYNIVMIIQIVTVLLLFVSAIFILRQLKIQTKTLNVQIFKNQVEMYWKTKEPITDLHIKSVKCFPDNYIGKSVYETRYKDYPEKTRKYLYLVSLYEYLFSVYESTTLANANSLWIFRKIDSLLNSKPPDLLRIKYLTKSLIFLKEDEEFIDVRNFYTNYYDEFEEYICNTLSDAKNDDSEKLNAIEE